MLTPSEIRTHVIEALTAPSARDRQRRVGASDLSGACDFCLAVKLQGGTRESALSRKTWLGRVMGTKVIHAPLEAAVADGYQREVHVWFGELGSYGKVGGSIDLLTPGEVIDYKGSSRKKSALMQDYLQSLGNFRVDLPPRWKQQARGGYKLEFSDCSYTLSAAEYAAEMAKQVTKVTSYYGQQQLYMRGSGRKRAALVFVNRDGTGFWDVPTEVGYEDEAKFHDVWVLPFEYNAEYADALLNRGRVIFEGLQSGKTPDDFPRHQHCFVCSNEAPADVPDIEVGWAA